MMELYEARRVNRDDKIFDGCAIFGMMNLEGKRFSSKIPLRALSAMRERENDLGAFMDGPEIVVHGNIQDCCGNTMNNGWIIVHGQAGDITGYSMRGGSIFIWDDVGYRAGIHMKEYGEKIPCLVIGGPLRTSSASTWPAEE